MKFESLQALVVVVTLAGCSGGNSSSLISISASVSETSTSGGSASTSGATLMGTVGTATTSTSGNSATATSSCSLSDCIDLGTGPPPCDVWQQDCIAGQKCSPYMSDGRYWDATKCVPIDPMPDPPGSACHTVDPSLILGDSCEGGSVCWKVVPETGDGICYSLCTGGAGLPTCNNADEGCWIAPDTALALCLPMCTPLGEEECADGDTCIDLTPDGFVCFPSIGMPAGYGDPCNYANACAFGLACLSALWQPECQSGGCCAPHCDTDSMPDMCPEEGQECIPWYEEGLAPAGYEHIGVCATP